MNSREEAELRNLNNIQPVKNALAQVIESIYPVGSIYIGVQSSCPIADLGIGTWQIVSSGKVLQGADSTHETCSSIDAGLPNITGKIESSYLTVHKDNVEGSLSYAEDARPYYGSTASTSSLYCRGISLDASTSSNIYGNSSTVQPPAYVVNIWQRVA